MQALMLSDYVARWKTDDARALVLTTHGHFLVETGALRIGDSIPVLARDGFHTGEIDIGEVRARHLPMQERRVFLLEKRTGNVFSQQICVGRTTNMDVCLPLSGISKFHAHFTQAEGGAFMLTDNESTNGTFVDGERLAADVPKGLGDGCEVRFATYAFRFMSTRRFAHLVDGLWEMRG